MLPPKNIKWRFAADVSVPAMDGRVRKLKYYVKEGEQKQ